MNKILTMLCIGISSLIPSTANAGVPEAIRILNQTERMPIHNEIKINAKEERRDMLCLALNVYHETRGSSTVDQLAVAKVTLNRAAQNNKSLCAVVYETRKRKVSEVRNGNQVTVIKTYPQFSWTIASTTAQMPKNESAWIASQNIAVMALRTKTDLTDGATHYYAPASLKAQGIPTPAWAKVGKDKKKIGAHIYMKMPEK